MSVAMAGTEANSPNGPTDRRENVTNEATDGPFSVIRGPLLVVGSSAIGEAMAGAESGRGRDSTELGFEIDYESMRARLAATQRRRAERIRKVKEESREL